MRHRPSSSLYENTSRHPDGDPLRGSADIHWSSMNPVQRDMAFMDGSFITQHHHILLLTIEEAQQVVRYAVFLTGPATVPGIRKYWKWPSVNVGFTTVSAVVSDIASIFLWPGEPSN